MERGRPDPGSPIDLSEGRTVLTTWQRFGTDDFDAQHSAVAPTAAEWPDALVITANSIRVPPCRI